jgi:hypothetical protein
MNTESLVPEHLRHLRAGVDGLREDLGELRTRVAHLEEQTAHGLALYATLSARLDRVQGIGERIERRLDLINE